MKGAASVVSDLGTDAGRCQHRSETGHTRVIPEPCKRHQRSRPIPGHPPDRCGLRKAFPHAFGNLRVHLPHIAALAHLVSPPT